LVERFFNMIKPRPRMAALQDKIAANYLASVQLGRPAADYDPAALN
jgi:hypothetical protein